MNNEKNFWPHYEIIQEIKNKNLNHINPCGLPDTKEINTFNLEAGHQGKESMYQSDKL